MASTISSQQDGDTSQVQRIPRRDWCNCGLGQLGRVERAIAKDIETLINHHRQIGLLSKKGKARGDVGVECQVESKKMRS